MTKYYIDQEGNYLGGFEGAKAPDGAIEIEAPPNHALDKWDGNQWIPYTESYKGAREAEYAKIPIGDQLDAIYKYALANGVVPDPNAKTDTPEGWVAKIQSIKDTYPKPE